MSLDAAAVGMSLDAAAVGMSLDDAAGMLAGSSGSSSEIVVEVL